MTTPTEYLRTVLARAEAATKGPWAHSEPWIVSVPSGPIADTAHQWNSGPACNNNATFIAHARDDVPALVKMLLDVIEIAQSGVDMPSYDQDDHCRLREKHRQILAKLQELVPGEK